MLQHAVLSAYKACSTVANVTSDVLRGTWGPSCWAKNGVFFLGVTSRPRRTRCFYDVGRTSGLCWYVPEDACGVSHHRILAHWIMFGYSRRSLYFIRLAFSFLRSLLPSFLLPSCLLLLPLLGHCRIPTVQLVLPDLNRPLRSDTRGWVQQCPLRSLESAIEVRQCTLRSGACG